MTRRIIVGVDPGTVHAGLVKLVLPKGKDTRIAYDPTTFNAEPRWKGTEVSIINIAMRIIEEAANGIHPYEVILAIEENFVGKDRAKSALKLRELIGITIGLAAYSGMHIIRVANTSAKLALTGSGGADKDDMVASAEPWFYDTWVNRPKYAKQAEADALGIALAGLGIWGQEHG